MLEEEQLNGRIASVINALTKSAGWQAREETWEVLRGPRTKPDVLITRGVNGPPIVLETEYAPASDVGADCMKSIGRELNTNVTKDVGVVNTVIAIRATAELKQCSTGDDAQKMLENGHEIGYAVYQGTEAQHTRFPKSGFINGNIRDLIDFIRPASEPQDIINAATQAFEQGVEDAATRILNYAKLYGFGDTIAATLRQPWPAWSAQPPAAPQSPDAAKKALTQEQADQNAREQTAKMTAAMLVNALSYQQNLAGYSAEGTVNGRQEKRTIKTLAQISKPTGLHPDDVIAEWDNILSINYWPIFHIAKQLLMIMPPSWAVELLNEMSKTANAIQNAIKLNDVAGIVFQKLIADRQTLATYYTRPESTVLAAHLAIPDDLDWADPETLKHYHIADYACGSGGLVFAAYQRARELHRNHGGDPDAVHAYMMENSLTACDIMPAAVHLTSSLLTSVAPQERYNGTRNVLYPYGGTGEMDKRGKPVVEIGSLGLLDLSVTRHQAIFPLNEGQMATGATEKRNAIEVEMAPLSQSLVIMNPPFTTPTNHAADHAKPGNPAFAAFNTTLAEQKAMAKKVKKLGKGTISDGNAGLGTQFAAIANNMVKPGGHIALILPLSAVLGGIWDGEQEWSWQKLRRLLSDSYNDIIIISIAQNKDIDSSFSADTNLAEVIIIARQLLHGESPKRRAHFVNLYHRPADKLAAQETARAIRRVIVELNQLDTVAEVCIGDDVVGAIQLENAPKRRSWTTARVANFSLVNTAKRLVNGQLYLPQRPQPVAIPVKPIGKIGNIGPLARDINESKRGPFETKEGANSGTEWPILWGKDSSKQIQMATLPDTSGTIRKGQSNAAVKLWQKASHLHINITFRFNSNPTAAAYTERRTLGGRAWPNLKMDAPEMEKAVCVWFNGTLGLISYWIESNRVQSGRGTVSITTLPNIPALDVTRLGAERLQAAVKIYDDLCEQRLLPANEAYRDPVRQELDRRLLTEVLGLDAAAVEQLAILRYQWCREPTVTGTKNTGPAD